MFPLDSAFRIPPRLKFSVLGCRAAECACKFQHQGGGARRTWSPRPTWATQPDLVPSTKNLVHPRACLTYSHTTLVGTGKNHPRIFTTMDSSQHPWHHQGRLIKATRTQLSDYSSHGSRGTKEGILPVSSAESHSCQATVVGQDPTGRSPEKRFGNKLVTQPPFLPPLLPNRVSLSPPPGPFILLSSKHLFTI